MATQDTLERFNQAIDEEGDTGEWPIPGVTEVVSPRDPDDPSVTACGTALVDNSGICTGDGGGGGCPNQVPCPGLA